MTHSAKHHSIGNVPSMTAMVAASATAGGYMPFSALALVQYAQAAIIKIASASRFAIAAPDKRKTALRRLQFILIVFQCAPGQSRPRRTALLLSDGGFSIDAPDSNYAEGY